MHVKEIYKDAHVGLDSSNPTVARNSGLAITWLEATFPELVERKMEEESVFLLRAHPYTPIEASLALQVCPSQVYYFILAILCQLSIFP